MTLCESDITSKNESKVHRYLQNFQRVRDKCEEVEEKDKLRNWEPPIGGAEIMNIFDLEPGRIVGELKAQIRESILDGEVENNLEDSMAFLLKIAEKRGLKPKKKV